MTIKRPAKRGVVRRYVPITDWLPSYEWGAPGRYATPRGHPPYRARASPARSALRAERLGHVLPFDYVSQDLAEERGKLEVVPARKDSGAPQIPDGELVGLPG